MLKRSGILFILSFAVIGLIATSYVRYGTARGTERTGDLSPSLTVPQNVLTGDWSASLVDDNSKLNLNFYLASETGRRHQFGHTFEFQELGLSREQVLNGGPARFTLAREAGTIDCEGSFRDRKGSGTFRFTGSSAFVSAMKSRGFDFEKETGFKVERTLEERLFTAAAINVTTALADDLSTAGFKLDVDDLFKAAIFHIDSAFMREMKATGFPNLTMEDLVKARIFKIDAQLVSQAAQMGFEKEGFDALIKMRIFKVTPEFVTEIRNEGLNNLSLEDVVKLRIFNIDGEFIRKAKAEGVPLNVERLVEKRLGVQRAARRVII